jgi:hypothetical protein
LVIKAYLKAWAIALIAITLWSAITAEQDYQTLSLLAAL